MSFQKLPSFTEWVNGQYLADDHSELYVPVQRILLPGKWPSWTFCTDDFRFSTRMPEGLENSLNDLSDLKDEETWSLVRMGIIVAQKRAKVTAQVRRYADVLAMPEKEKQLYGWLNRCGVTWYGITYYLPGVTGVNSAKTYTDEFLTSFGLTEVIPVTPASSEAPPKPSKKRKTSS